MSNLKLLLAALLLATMQLRAGAMQLKMVLWNGNAVRIRIVPGAESPGLPALNEFNGLLPRKSSGKVVELQAIAGQKGIELGDWRAQVTAAPLKIRLQKNGRLVQTLEVNETNGAITFALGNGPVLGLGEGGQQFDRRGGFFAAKNGQADNTRKLGARIAVPLLIGTEGWAMFISTPANPLYSRSSDRNLQLSLRVLTNTEPRPSCPLRLPCNRVKSSENASVH